MSSLSMFVSVRVNSVVTQKRAWHNIKLTRSSIQFYFIKGGAYVN